jgi:hypothetical protein
MRTIETSVLLFAVMLVATPVFSQNAARYGQRYIFVGGGAWPAQLGPDPLVSVGGGGERRAIADLAWVGRFRPSFNPAVDISTAAECYRLTAPITFSTVLVHGEKWSHSEQEDSPPCFCVRVSVGPSLDSISEAASTTGAASTGVCAWSFATR